MVARTWKALWRRDTMSGQRDGDRVGHGRGQPSDLAAQVTGAGEQLAVAQAEVGVGEDFRQVEGQAGAGQYPGEHPGRQIGVVGRAASRSR